VKLLRALVNLQETDEKLSNLRNNCPSDTMSTANPTLIRKGI
jgi:hypothetical protein